MEGIAQCQNCLIHQVSIKVTQIIPGLKTRIIKFNFNGYLYLKFLNLCNLFYLFSKLVNGMLKLN